VDRLIEGSLFLIVIVMVHVVGVILWNRRFRGGARPTTAGRTGKGIRAGEMSVLALLALVLWYKALLAAQIDGEFIFLSDVALPIVRRAHLTMFAATLAIAVVGLVVGAFWRMSAGITIVILTGATFSTINAYSGAWVPTLAGFDPEKPPIPIEFRLNDGIEQADLTVNGILLGRTPFSITLDELLQRVPEWESEAAQDRMVAQPHRDEEGHGPDQRFRRMRVEFYLSSNHRSAGWKHFYASVDRDGEPGVPARGVTQTGGITHGGNLTAAIVNLGVSFPSQLAAIEKQLDRARLLNYTPDDAWFEKMDSLGELAWRQLREARMYEPELDSVMDAWARRTYRLDRATDESTSTEILKEILADCIQRGEYSTLSPAGRAVRLLTAGQDADALVDLTIASLEAGSRLSMGFSYSNFLNEIVGEHPRRKNVFDHMVTGSGKAAEPVLMTDAIMLLDYHLDTTHPHADNAIERRLVPYLLQRSHDRETSLEDAIFLGGSHVDEFLLRQNWEKRPVDESDPVYARSVSTDTLTNRWLLALANHDSLAAAEFRRKHRQELLKLATQLLQARDGFFGGNWNDAIDFVFLHGNESGSLAEEFWPVFKGLVQRVKDSRERLILCYRYLARIHPLSTPKQFCDLYEYDSDQSVSHAIENLHLIPAEAGVDVLNALLIRNQELIDEVDSHPVGKRKQLLNSDRGAIQHMIETLDPVAKNARIVKAVEQNLHSQREFFRQHLANGQPAAQLVALLAKSPIAELRKMAVIAARNHPTAVLRATLKQLTDDEAQDVRAAATTATGELEVLRTAGSGH
jgi:hypothetical protein